MHYLFYDNKLGARLLMTDTYQPPARSGMGGDELYKIIWNRGEERLLQVDGVPVLLAPHQLLFLTPNQCPLVTGQGNGLLFFLFNREFYCVQQHDPEVSCIGLLFYGTPDTPVIALNKIEQVSFEALFSVFRDEFETRDHIQGEMLVMLLKRLIIKSARIARERLSGGAMPSDQLDIIRRYHVLVEMNFRTLRQVAAYAALLNKSPKTLANLFARYQQPSPLRVIHNRLLLEARRLLSHTGKSAKEIAAELGFEDAAQFSHFFKNAMDVSPSAFRQSIKILPAVLHP